MSESTRPNVLFVFADQMRRSALGCMGNGDVATPHLDQLAEQGLCATRAVANCPLCGPSRASILTGRYPLSHQVVSNWLPLPHRERTFGELFGERGWATGYIGKWHHPSLASRHAISATHGGTTKASANSAVVAPLTAACHGINAVAAPR